MFSVSKSAVVGLFAFYAMVAAVPDRCAAQIVPITGLSSVRTDVAAINDDNGIVGHYFTNFDGPFGYVHMPVTGMRALPKPAGTLYTEPYAISENGIIAGQAYSGFGSPGKIMKTAVGSVTAAGISPPSGFTGGAAYGVNEGGTMVGHFFGPGTGGSVFSHTDAGGFNRFPSGYSDAMGINNAGQVTGSFFLPNSPVTGYRRETNGTRTPIGALVSGGESYGRVINSNGTVFGHAGDGNRGVPVRYTTSGGLVQLQSFVGQNVILGANDFNHAVGFQYNGFDFDATLWRPNGTLLNLDDWLNATHPALGALWELEEARDINNLGYIVGEGYYQDPVAGLTYRAFILDARTISIPEPATALTGSATAAAAMLLMRRRR